MKTLTLATFNVRGLAKPHKQQQLIRNVTRYKIDVCAIQEAKVQQLSDTSLDNHGVIFFETKSPHYGNGFIVSPQLKNNVRKYWNASDRISGLQIKLSNTVQHYRNLFRIQEQCKFESSTKWESYKCLPIPKFTIKREFIPDPKNIISIINVYAPTSLLVRDAASVL